ncbi:MAG: DUF1905 domain-containing protein [Pseudobdellovibrionaceae bacterium]
MNPNTKMKKYSFKGKVWKYKGPTGWYFVTLPRSLSKTIRKIHGLSEEGWGRLKANAAIGNCKWQTAIWHDSKAMSYLLPIKASVRKATGISSGSSISVILYLQYENPKFSLFSRQR